MSLLSQVVAITGATRADVVRVATRGGDTRADWDIAYAIEAAGGRRASELMLTAGRDQMIARIWGETGESAQAPAPTNPDAKRDKTVRIYPEDTAPDSPNRIAPHHPHEDAEDTGPTREEQAQAAHADLAEVLDDTRTAARLAKKWASRISAVHQAARQEVQRLLLSHPHPRTRRRAVRRARRARRMALAA